MRDSETLTIGVFAPSLPTIGKRTTAIEQAVAYLRRLGHVVVEGESYRSMCGYKSAPAKVRAKDLTNFLSSPEVDLILATTGGYNSNEILAEMCVADLRRSDAVFVGYSDCTILSMALHNAGVCRTVCGPMLVDYVAHPHFFQDITSALSGASYRFSNPDVVWENDERKKYEIGPLCLLEGKILTASGHAFGANLSTMCLGLGTPYFVNLDGAVLFLEYDREEQTALPSLERFLWQLRLAGKMEKLSALVFGALQESVRAEENEQDSIRRILTDVTEGFNFPVVYNAQFGHIYPSWVVVNGRKISIEGTQITSGGDG